MGDSTVLIHSVGEVSLSDKLSAVNEIVVDVCGHCNRSCDADGLRVKLFNVICARDGFMLHVTVRILIASITNLFSLAMFILNMVYYYKHNNPNSLNHQ